MRAHIFPILGRSYTREALKSSGKVALVEKAGFNRNLGNRCVGVCHLATRELNSQATDILPNRAVMTIAKLTG